MIRNLTISAVLNGFIVQVGCQNIVYTSVGELTADLSDYLRDPEATEKRILKEKGLNRKHTLGSGEIAWAAPIPANVPNAMYANAPEADNSSGETPARPMQDGGSTGIAAGQLR